MVTGPMARPSLAGLPAERRSGNGGRRRLIDSDYTVTGDITMLGAEVEVARYTLSALRVRTGAPGDPGWGGCATYFVNFFT